MIFPIMSSRKEEILFLLLRVDVALSWSCRETAQKHLAENLRFGVGFSSCFSRGVVVELSCVIRPPNRIRTDIATLTRRPYI